MVGATKPGTRSTMTVWRKGAMRSLTLTIAELEPENLAKKKTKQPKDEQAAEVLGLIVSDLTPAQLKELGIDGGVVVDSSEGAAARVGLSAGEDRKSTRMNSSQ